MTNLPDRAKNSSDDESVRFVADARLISILGEQLIGSEKVGILELVKNAYDAGASNCTVTIEAVPGLDAVPTSNGTRTLTDYAALPGPVIEVRDDGSGMSRTDIVDGWLRPATSSRAKAKEKLRRERERARKDGTTAEYDAFVETLREEHGGRLPLGEKGVGRLATHRLGQQLWLRTKQAGDDYELELRIDWRRFDDSTGKAIDLSSIELELKQHPPTTDYGPSSSGTVICCYGGRPGYEWTQDTIVEVGQAVVSLQSPYRGSKFRATFVSPHVPKDQIAAPLALIPAPFELSAAVDEHGIADFELKFTPPEQLEHKPQPFSENRIIDLRTLNKAHWRLKDEEGLRSPVCGPFFVHIRSWVRSSEWLGPDYKTITKYLDRFGGIAVYRDGILAQAAQLSSKNDWLGLSIKQIKKTSKISYYQLAGEIELDQAKTLDLRDRSSREGMIETKALQDLAELTRALVTELENHRRGTRDEWTKKTRATRVSAASVRAEARLAGRIAERLKTKYNFKTDDLGLKNIGATRSRVATVASRMSHLRDYLKLREEENAGLSEAAGFGLAISIGIHELAKIASAIAVNSRFIARNPTSPDVPERARDITKGAESLLGEIRRIEPLRVVKGAAKRATTIRRTIELARNAFALTLDREGIDMKIQGEDFPIFVKVGALAQVFANLVDNSVYWVIGTNEQRKEIRVILDASKRTVLFADSGRGISPTIRPHLFKPFFSEKSPPSGLGLYICRNYLADERASIRLARADERCELAGAQFLIDFSKTAES